MEALKRLCILSESQPLSQAVLAQGAPRAHPLCRLPGHRRGNCVQAVQLTFPHVSWQSKPLVTSVTSEQTSCSQNTARPGSLDPAVSSSRGVVKFPAWKPGFGVVLGDSGGAVRGLCSHTGKVRAGPFWLTAVSRFGGRPQSCAPVLSSQQCALSRVLA